MPSRDIAFRLLNPEEQLADPLLGRLLQDWRFAALWSDLPSTRFADPLRLRYLLGSLVLLDVVPSEYGLRRYRYRLIGTNIVAHQGRDRTGSWLDQHDEAEFAAAAQKVCDLVVEQRCPVYAGVSRQILDRFYPVQHLILPLGTADGTVIRLLGGEIYPATAPVLAYGNQWLPSVPLPALADAL